MKRSNKPLTVNPLAEIFPMASADEQAEMVKSIEANGLLEPGQLDAEGRILDGRNRELCCRAANPPALMRWRKWPGRGSTEKYIAYVIGHNLHRRHLTTAQRSACAVELAKRLAEVSQESESSRKFTGKKNGEKLPENKADSPQCHVAPEVQAAAAAFSVSPSSVEKAIQAEEAQPGALDAMKRGETTANAVLREAAQAEQTKPAEKPLKDRNGQKVPRRISETWRQACEELSDAAREIERIRKYVVDLCGGPDSVKPDCRNVKPEPFARFIRPEQFHAAMLSARRVLTISMPYAVCYSCGGDGCRVCCQLGWIPKDYWTRRPDEFK